MMQAIPSYGPSCLITSVKHSWKRALQSVLSCNVKCMISPIVAADEEVSGKGRKLKSGWLEGLGELCWE